MDILTVVIEALLCLLISTVLLAVHKKIKKLYYKKRTERIKESFKEDIWSIDNVFPYYKPENIIFQKSGDDKFFIPIPDDQLSIIRTLRSDFSSNNEAVFSYGSLDKFLKAFVDVLNRKDFVTLFEKHRNNVANDFIRKIRTGQILFNNEKFGIKHLDLNRACTDESPQLMIKLFKTDYYTHKVMGSIYRELKKDKHPIADITYVGDVNKYYPFLTSFGLNTLIILNKPPNCEEIVLAKRSKYLDPVQQEDFWHVSMNEGLSYKDDQGKGKINPADWVSRGLNEELGINYGGVTKQSVFCDLFMVKDHFEIGITNFVKLNMTCEDLVNLHKRAAQDGKLEITEIKTIKFKDIAKICKETNVTPVCKYTLAILKYRQSEIEALDLGNV